MPQLDKLSIINQLTWLIIIFFSLYFIVIRNVLPVIYRNLRIRSLLSEKLVKENRQLFREIKKLYRNVHIKYYKYIFSINKIITHYEKHKNYEYINNYNNFSRIINTVKTQENLDLENVLMLNLVLLNQIKIKSKSK